MMRLLSDKAPCSPAPTLALDVKSTGKGVSHCGGFSSCHTPAKSSGLIRMAKVERHA